MSVAESMPPVLVIRLHWVIGSGRTEVLHLDQRQQESLSLTYKHSGRPDNIPKDLLQVIKGSLGAGITKTIIDLSNIAWLNSTGLGQLIEWKELIEKGGGQVVYANPIPRVAKVFEVTELDRVFTVMDTFQDAVKHLSAEGQDQNK